MKSDFRVFFIVVVSANLYFQSTDMDIKMLPL